MQRSGQSARHAERRTSGTCSGPGRAPDMPAVRGPSAEMDVSAAAQDLYTSAGTMPLTHVNIVAIAGGLCDKYGK